MNNIVKKTEKILKNVKGKTIGFLGLSFKPDTDDMRDAPSVVIINKLVEKGAKVKVFDPIAMENAKKIIKGVEFCKDPYETAKGSEILIVVTEWNEFRQIDLKKVGNLMKEKVIIDGRNIYDPEKVKELGFTYVGVGR